MRDRDWLGCAAAGNETMPFDCSQRSSTGHVQWLGSAMSQSSPLALLSVLVCSEDLKFVLVASSVEPCTNVKIHSSNKSMWNLALTAILMMTLRRWINREVCAISRHDTLCDSSCGSYMHSECGLVQQTQASERMSAA